MPKRRNSSSVSSAANGEAPKKQEKNLPKLNESADVKEEGKLDNATLSEVLFKEMELATVSPLEKFSHFDFKRISVDGYTAEELRSHYERLRSAAFRSSRHLPLKKEMKFIREFAAKEMSKAVDDASKIKRPMTTYLRFAEVAKRKLLKKHPDLKGKACTTWTPLIAEQWKKLSDVEKRPYLEAYQAEKKEYDRKIEAIKGPTTKTAKKAKTANSSKAKATLRRKIPLPKSAFDLFSAAKGKEYAEKYGLKGDELKLKLAAKYGKLSDRKRQKWEELAKESLAEYVQALASKEQSQATASAASQEDTKPPQASSTTKESPQKSPPKSEKRKKDEYDDYIASLTSSDAASSPNTKKGKSSKRSKEETAGTNSWLD